MKNSYLKMYYKWMETGQMSGAGLCPIFHYSAKIQLFAPTMEESKEHKISYVYWGSGDQNWRKREFTTLRQTIVLFMAAINNEL